jgi:hypothetical protein
MEGMFYIGLLFYTGLNEPRGVGTPIPLISASRNALVHENK